MTVNPEISVIVPMTKRFDDVVSLYRDYKAALEATARSFEFVYVLESHFEDRRRELENALSWHRGWLFYGLAAVGSAAAVAGGVALVSFQR